MKQALLTAIFGLVCLAPNLRADYLLSGSQNGLGASANFSISNGVLTITVTDTSTNAATSAGQILTGMYFNVKGGTNPGFTSTGATATAPAGTVAVNGNTTTTLTSNTNAGAAWGFDAGLSGTPYGMPYGFISTALVCHGSACGTTLTGTALTTSSVYGGLVNGGSDPGTWVDRNSVIFTLNLPKNTTFTTADISNVAFQFGDAGLGESDFQVLPEPASYAGTILLLLVPLAWYARKRGRSAASEAVPPNA
jgi:hypothetical protein